jgi:16S rRNA (cytosine967-C5)-methyltransferase
LRIIFLFNLTFSFVCVRAKKSWSTKTSAAGIDFNMISETCLALPNASKIDEMLELDKEVVIQDNQFTEDRNIDQLRILTSRIDKHCLGLLCGSGGKSIMIYDINPKIELTVFDT